MNPFLRLISLVVFAAGCSGSSGSVGFAGTLLSISSTGAAVGMPGKLRVTFDNPLASDTNVMLMSSTPSVATVGDHVTVPRGAVSAEMTWTGVALGQTTFYATAGAATQLTTASVVDHFTVQSIGSNDTTLEKGSSTLVYVSLNAVTPDPVMIDLSAADATVVGVPASVAVSPWASLGRVTLNALTVGTTTLTATSGTDSVTSNINVVDHARLQAQSSLQAQVVEVGGTIVGEITVDASVAMPTTVTATTSDATIAAAPANVVIPSGSRSTTVRIPVIGAGMTTLTFTLADSSLTVPVTGVAALHLLSINLGTPLQLGSGASGSVSLDAVAGIPHQIALTSSDPTILDLPAEITVGPGATGANFLANPLKSGTVTVSASFSGATVSTLVYVGDSGASLSLNWYQQRRLVVGATAQVEIDSTATSVQLTASTPGILGFPQMVNVPSYGYVYTQVTALKTGSTTLTASSGPLSSAVDLEVLSTPDLQVGPTFTVDPGSSTVGSVSFQALAPTGTYLTFTTSNPNVLASPPPVTLSSTSSGADFQLTGVAAGTAILTVSTMGVSKTAVVYVGTASSAPVYLSFVNVGNNSLELNAATFASVQFSDNATADIPVTLKVSPAPVASFTDSNPVLPAGQSTLYLPLVGKGVGTAMVSATAGGVTRSSQVTVLASPTFSMFVAPGTITAGTTVDGSIFSDCLLATDRVVALSSSDTAVAVVSPASVKLIAGTNQAAFEVRGVTTGNTFINFAPNPLPSPSPMPIAVTVQ